MHSLISVLLLQTLQFHSVSFQEKRVTIPEQGTEAHLPQPHANSCGWRTTAPQPHVSDASS